MKLEKAIRIETIHNEHNPDFTDAEREQAHQLLIEAGKEVKKSREEDYIGDTGLLPGETED